MPSRRLILWATFVLLIAVEVYGLATTHILAQSIWSSVGLRRLIGFVVAYVVVAGTTLIWRPRLCIPLLLVIFVAWTILAVGWISTFSAALICLGAWQLGRLVLAAEQRNELRLLVGFAIYSFVESLLVRFPINGRLLAVVLMALPFGLWLWFRRSEKLFQFGYVLELLRQSHRRQQLAVAIAGLPLAAHWLVALGPEASNDALTMHLAAPAAVAHAGFWGFDYHDALWALMPMGGDWLYTLGYLLGGEASARLINLVLLGIIAALIFKLSRVWLAEVEAALVTALFLSTPLVQLVTGSLFVENFWTAMVIGAFAAGLPLAGLLLGAAAASKLGAIAFAIPLLILTFGQTGGAVYDRALFHRTRTFSNPDKKRAVIDRASSKTALPFAVLLFLIFAAPPYVTAYLKTGNPIFPFRGDVFTSSFHVPPSLVRDLRFERPIEWKTLYDLTFHTERFMEGQNGAAGFQYLLIVPMSLLAAFAFDKKREWSAIAAAVSGFLLVFSMQSNLRYCYPAMAFACIAFGKTLAACKAESKALHRCVVAACVAIAMLNTYFLAASGYLHRDFWLNPLKKAETREYIERYAPARPLIDEANQIAPGEPVMFIDTVHTAGLRGKAFTSGWYHWPLVLQLDTAISPHEVLSIAAARGVRHFISPEPNSIMRPAVGPFLTQFTDVTAKSGSFQLRTLKTDFKDALSLPTPPADAAGELLPMRAGKHDDNDPAISYSGLWARAGLFPGSYGESFMYSNIPGAQVGFSFEGSGFDYIYGRAFNRGRAEVRVDDGEWQVIDQYSPTIEWQTTRSWTGLKPGVHRVQIRVLPERDPNSEGYYVDIDAVVVR